MRVYATWSLGPTDGTCLFFAQSIAMASSKWTLKLQASANKMHRRRPNSIDDDDDDRRKPTTTASMKTKTYSQPMIGNKSCNLVFKTIKICINLLEFPVRVSGRLVNTHSTCSTCTHFARNCCTPHLPFNHFAVLSLLALVSSPSTRSASGGAVGGAKSQRSNLRTENTLSQRIACNIVLWTAKRCGERQEHVQKN